MGWERELQLLERAIQRANAEYDAFLFGAVTKPPLETKKTVDEMIRRLSAAEPDSAADRYRFNTLQGRYVACCERWERLQTEKESGLRPGVHSAFARESRQAVVSPVPPPRRDAPNAAAPRSVSPGKASAQEQVLFERYLAAKKARGEDMAGYDLSRFVEGLNRERAKLKERFGDVAVEFDVTDRDGRVRLIARKKS